MNRCAAPILERDEIVALWRSRLRPLCPLPAGREAFLPTLSGVRGVVFDLYGTLFVSAAGDIGHTAAENERHFRTVLSGFGLSPAAGDVGGFAAAWRNGIVQRHAAAQARGVACPEVDIRDVWRDTLACLLGEGRLAGPQPDAAAIERLALAYEAAVNPVWPMPETAAVLRSLQSAGRILGIVSNAQFFSPFLFDALLGAPIERLGFSASLCIWSYRLGEAKPSPRLFETLLHHARAAGIHRPDALLYVGNDMLNDVWAAGRAGLRTALFAGDRRSLRLRADDPRCRHLQPDAVLSRLDQLPGVLGLTGG